MSAAKHEQGPFVMQRGALVPYRHVHRHEWLHAWHYARYGRRHNSIPVLIGPILRDATRAVMHQRRDPLAVRQSMAKVCHPLSAVIATTREFRATIASTTGSAS